MTPEQQNEIQRRAKQDATAQMAGWPTKGNPFSSAEKATVYQKAFDAAAKKLKELRK